MAPLSSNTEAERLCMKKNEKTYYTMKIYSEDFLSPLISDIMFLTDTGQIKIL